MDRAIEKAIEAMKPLMEGIVYLKNGRVDRVETPDGYPIQEGDRSERLRAVVEIYANWPYRANGRIFVYKNTTFPMHETMRLTA